MRYILLIILNACILANMTCPGEVYSSEKDAHVTFRTANIFIDSGREALAAYQVEITYDKEHVKIVGLEGGETGAFSEPPYYDAAGMEGGRIVVAAFTSDDNKNPKGNTRVARVHLQFLGIPSVEFEIKLVTAAKTGGERITVIPRIVMQIPADQK